MKSAQDETDARCGEYAGYQAHKRAKEDPCAACRRANSTYMARWRKRNPGLQSLHQDNQAARGRALRRLATMFPDELQALDDHDAARSRLYRQIGTGPSRIPAGPYRRCVCNPSFDQSCARCDGSGEDDYQLGRAAPAERAAFNAQMAAFRQLVDGPTTNDETPGDTA